MDKVLFTKDNIDNLTSVGNNFVRFTKFNTWVGEKEKLSVADVKGIVNVRTAVRAYLRGASESFNDESID